MYAGDNKDYFPDNSKGRDLSWMSPDMNTFYQLYLYPNRRGTVQSQRNRNDVLYCPTDEWHRIAETGILNDTDPQLIGFFYLPGRTTDNGWPYNSVGLGEWHLRKKLGGPYRHAPIMSDRLQSRGTWSVAFNSGSLTWQDTFAGKTYWTASHRLQSGIPTGGNFLFEDGHVEWKTFKLANPRATVDVGSMSGSWVLFYKPANVQTNM
jgi:hypothetical protein